MNDSLIYGFEIFVCYVLINIVCDFFIVIINRLFYRRLFKFKLIINDVFVDHERLRTLLHLSKFSYQLYLKGIFIFNREQILIISSYLHTDPNEVYTIKII